MKRKWTYSAWNICAEPLRTISDHDFMEMLKRTGSLWELADLHSHNTTFAAGPYILLNRQLNIYLHAPANQDVSGRTWSLGCCDVKHLLLHCIVLKDHETSQAGSRGFRSGDRATGKICQGFSMESQGIAQEILCVFVMLKHPHVTNSQHIIQIPMIQTKRHVGHKSFLSRDLSH